MPPCLCSPARLVQQAPLSIHYGLCRQGCKLPPPGFSGYRDPGEAECRARRPRDPRRGSRPASAANLCAASLSGNLALGVAGIKRAPRQCGPVGSLRSTTATLGFPFWDSHGVDSGRAERQTGWLPRAHVRPLPQWPAKANLTCGCQWRRAPTRSVGPPLPDRGQTSCPWHPHGLCPRPWPRQ